MQDDRVTVDFTHAKSALAARQTFAKVLGVSLAQELTWGMLHDAIRSSEFTPPPTLLIHGLSSLSQAVPEEAQMVRALLKDFSVTKPDVKIRIKIHN